LSKKSKTKKFIASCYQYLKMNLDHTARSEGLWDQLHSTSQRECAKYLRLTEKISNSQKNLVMLNVKFLNMSN
jgi:hypothetical protein